MGKPKFDLVELWLQIPVIWGTNEKPPPNNSPETQTLLLDLGGRGSGKLCHCYADCRFNANLLALIS